jgi:heptosyltransferase-3
VPVVALSIFLDSAFLSQCRHPMQGLIFPRGGVMHIHTLRVAARGSFALRVSYFATQNARRSRYLDATREPPGAGGGVKSFSRALRDTLLSIRATRKSLRRNSRLLLGRSLARMMGPPAYETRLSPNVVSSVLVCRINGRLGNAVFLTPLINRLHELFPAAIIDLAMSYPQAPSLLQKLPGVRQVIHFPHKGVGMVWRYFAALRCMRATNYDVVIDPTPESTSGRIVLTLCRAKYRIGFAVDSQWAPLTHAIPESPEKMHQAVLPVYLLSTVFGAPCDQQGVRLSLHLQGSEVEAGRAAISTAIQRKKLLAGSAGTFGFFAHGTGSKPLERAWWMAFWKAFLELEPGATPVEFLPTPSAAPTDERLASLHFQSVRELTAAISTTRMFISADTGPMHLASATSVPTVALFQASDPALYRPLKIGDLVIDARDCPPWLAAQHCHAVWRLAPRQAYTTA